MSDGGRGGSGTGAHALRDATPAPAPGAITWTGRAVAAVGVLVVLGVCATAWTAVVHGHPLYPVLLAVTLVGCLAFLARSVTGRGRPSRGWRTVGRVALVLLALGWIAFLGWLRPFAAVEPALAAMTSDARVSVAEYPTQIVLTPTGTRSGTALFFQPGARVDARAYVAVLRPVAEAGHLVVIPKQPLGIAFLATTAFTSTRAAYPDVSGWVVGGHSLGGTVASMDASAHDADPQAPVVGLLLYASYPASDLSGTLRARVLSISGSEDGLATPAKIEASRATLPPSTRFVVVDGAVHAYFGDYGPQPGDGTPTVPHDEARTRISQESVAFLASVGR